MIGMVPLPCNIKAQDGHYSHPHEPLTPTGHHPASQRDGGSGVGGWCLSCTNSRYPTSHPPCLHRARLTGASLSTEYHVGRSWWPSHHLEDGCPCPKAECGLVVMSGALPDCPEHAWFAGKSLREVHKAEDCARRMAEAAKARQMAAHAVRVVEVRGDVEHEHERGSDDRCIWCGRTVG